jgi:hypothetical protein
MIPPRTNKESVERGFFPSWMVYFGALERFIKSHDRLPYVDENKAHQVDMEAAGEYQGPPWGSLTRRKKAAGKYWVL